MYCKCRYDSHEKPFSTCVATIIGFPRVRDDANEEPADGSESTEVEVSVVIPAFQGRATIVECLESVVGAVAGRSCEIIVVESSHDGAADLVRARFPGVRVIEPAERLSAGAARNEGFRHARGCLFLCVDQDCLVPPDWIPRMVELLGRDGVGAAGGSIGVANPRNLAGWCVYFLEFFTHFPSRGPIREDNYVVGANSGWRPEAIRGQAFPDRTLGEDLLATASVRANGFRILYDPSLAVLHRNRSGWGEFLRYCRAMGAAAAESQTRLGGRAIQALHRIPAMSYGIPFLVLPRIGWKLLGAPRGYLATYIALLPCCVVGHFTWADAFCRSLRQRRTKSIAVS